MSLRSIGKIKLPQWLTQNKSLKTGLLFLAVLLCADALLYGLLLVPSAEALRKLEIKYSDLRKRHTDALLFQKQKQELAGIRTGVPTQKDMPLLIKELVQRARRLNLSVSSITYDIPKRSGQELVLLSFSFPAEGRYPDVKRFIYEVETSDRLIGIRDIKFEEDKGRVKIDMKLMTYIKGQ